jgi:UDP-N-acetylglucosamine transferase subunit ALG13
MGTIAEAIPKSSFWRIVDLILVLVGTNPYSFDRLVRAVDKYAVGTDEDVFVQLGNTGYKPINCRFERFLDKEDIIRKIREASVVITQGGFGSIADCLREGKPTVAVPRKPELREAPDRQEDLVRELASLGRVVGVYEIEDLPEAIGKARTTTGHNVSTHKITNLIERFIRDN